MKLSGRVRSGIGDFGQWIERLKDHYQRKTGMVLYPGTLNLELGVEWSMPAGCDRLDASDYGGRVTVLILPCRFKSTPAWILRTEANEAGTGDHPRTVIEIASAIHLRQSYGLKDGDEVEIEL